MTSVPQRPECEGDDTSGPVKRLPRLTLEARLRLWQSTWEWLLGPLPDEAGEQAVTEAES
jgi:hypothetical protein